MGSRFSTLPTTPSAAKMSSKYSVISLDDDGDENEGIMLTSLNSNVHKSKIPTIVHNNTSWGKGINSNIISMVLTQSLNKPFIY